MASTGHKIGGKHVFVGNCVCWLLIAAFFVVDLLASVLANNYNLGLIVELLALLALGYVVLEVSRDRWTAALWQIVTIGIFGYVVVRLVERNGTFAARPYYLSGEAVAVGLLVILLWTSLSGALFDVRYYDGRIAVNGRTPYRQSAWTWYYSAVLVALVAAVFYEIFTVIRDAPRIPGLLTAGVRLACLAAVIGLKALQARLQNAGHYVAELWRLVLMTWMLDWLRLLDGTGNNVWTIPGIVVRLTFVLSLLYIEGVHAAGSWEALLRRVHKQP